jgi:hypothetical protein
MGGIIIPAQLVVDNVYIAIFNRNFITVFFKCSDSSIDIFVVFWESYAVIRFMVICDR